MCKAFTPPTLLPHHQYTNPCSVSVQCYFLQFRLPREDVISKVCSVVSFKSHNLSQHFLSETLNERKKELTFPRLIPSRLIFPRGASVTAEQD